jgi:hypothetical protein
VEAPRSRKCGKGLRRLAYTTVLTILRTLRPRGLRGEEEGGGPILPGGRARDGAGVSVQRLIGQFFGGNPESLLTHLVEGM